MKLIISMLWCNCELILYLMRLCTNVLVNGTGYNGNCVLIDYEFKLDTMR
jgi:hypothetical protein